MSELTAREIAQRIVNNTNHLPEDNEFIRLAKAHLSQETRIQGLVEALEIIASYKNAFGVKRAEAIFAEKALTAYKEGK